MSHIFVNDPYDDRKRCPETGKVILDWNGANLVEQRLGGDLVKYKCGNHWHMGHPRGSRPKKRQKR